jgi:hypothetical protein
VTASLIALQQLQTIPGWNHEIVDAAGGVQQLQFPLNDAPEFPGNSPSGPSVSFAKQVDGCHVGE